MPRWRRPSLLEARKTDPLRSASTAVNLTFANGAVEAVAGKERRRIRYRLVRLMDVPDEPRANEIGILDEGDEVQILGTSGIYRLVLCPDSGQGWLHQNGPRRRRQRRLGRTRRARARRDRRGHPERLPRPPPEDGLTPVPGRSQRPRRRTRMCWCAMFGTKERG